MATPEIEARARELADADWEQREAGFVECPECGSWQADMGRGVLCEAVAIDSEDTCDYAPMPTRVGETDDLLAYVRELTAGLTHGMRFALRGLARGLRSWEVPRPSTRALRRRCLLAHGSADVSPLGRAVLRVLGGDDGSA